MITEVVTQISSVVSWLPLERGHLFSWCLWQGWLRSHPGSSSVVSWSAQLQPIEVDSVVCLREVGAEDWVGTIIDRGEDRTVCASSTWSSWSML